MTVAEMKKSFVEHELTHLIKKIDKGIIRAEYEFRPENDPFEGGEEFVTVHYDHTSISICVTADSLSALTTDVIKAVE